MTFLSKTKYVTIIIVAVIILIINYDSILINIKASLDFGYGYTDTYQHNTKYYINNETYKYVYEYKKQLLQQITDLLNSLNIRFVIANGSLVEYMRKKPIYHDDDLDIRFCAEDFDNWEKYYNDYNKNNIFNLNFSDRSIADQRRKGVQIRLLNFNNTKNIVTFPDMDIHCDLVSSSIQYGKKTWMDYNIDFNNLDKIKFYDIDTYSPNDKDTIKVLKAEYGPNYMIPNKKYKMNINID